MQPLVAPAQAQDVNFTISTISINRVRKGATPPVWTPEGAAAFEVVEGLLSIKIGEYPEAKLTTGDVAFIPKGTEFQYWSEVALTKVLFVSAGKKGVDQQLINAGKKWEYPAFPRY